MRGVALGPIGGAKLGLWVVQLSAALRAFLLWLAECDQQTR